MSTPTIQDFVARNEQYSHEHKPFPTFQESIEGGYPAPKTVVISCADPRSNPNDFLQLKGDAVVLRTVGAKPETCIEALLSVDSILQFDNIIVAQHTDCGALVFRDTEIKKGLKDLAPGHTQEIDGFRFRDITGTLEESVRDGVKFLQSSPFLRPELKENVAGFVFDIKTGKLRPV